MKKKKSKIWIYAIITICIIIGIIFVIFKTSIMKDKRTTVFIRDDDPYSITPELSNISHLFIDEKIPVNYEVIPSRLDDDFVYWIKDMKQKNPDLIEIDMHGWKHMFYSCGEFGPCRTYEQQLSDIIAARNIMEDKFGDDFSRVFTPPYNRYDVDTIRALDDQNFSVISSSVSQKFTRLYILNPLGKILGANIILNRTISYQGNRIANYNVTEISICVDVLENYTGDIGSSSQNQTRVKSFDEMKKDFEDCRNDYQVVGIMVHHWAFATDQDRNTLKEFIEYLKEDKTVEFYKLEDIDKQIRNK